MTKIVLVRHGQTEWNVLGKYQGQSDIDLSPEGIRQAEKLASKLEVFHIEHLDAVYSSDLKRAMITAGFLAEKASCSVIARRQLRELNFGCWEGLTYQQITKQWPDEVQNFFTRPDLLVVPNGETFAEVQQRAMQEVYKIISEHPGQTAAIVAHGAIIRTILAAVLHMPLRYIWSIRQDNTAVNIFRSNEDGFLLELLNSTAHLQIKAQ